MRPELRVATAVVRDAGRLASRLQPALTGGTGHSKADVDGTGFGVSPVTVADFAVQVLILGSLATAFPHDRFIAEESSRELRAAGTSTTNAVVAAIAAHRGRACSAEEAFASLDLGATGTHGGWSSANRTWVLDPIDGTKGFVRGDQYAVALSLLEGGQPTVGVLGCPNLDLEGGSGAGSGTIFWAARGDGAHWCGGGELGGGVDDAQRLCVSVPAEPRAGLVRAEAYERGHSNHAVAAAAAASLGIASEPMRMDGQGKYGMVAAGRAHVYTRLPRAGYRENIWDHAAGALIVEEAGGRVTDTLGRPLDFSRGAKLAADVTGIVASNGESHADILRALRGAAPAARAPDQL